MNIWPFKKKAASQVAASPVTAPNPGQYAGIIREPFAGAWQRGLSITPAEPLQNPAVFACISMISGDIGKLRPVLQRKRGGIWQDAETNLPILETPNSVQTRNAFYAQWVSYLLTRGNAYAIIKQDSAGQPVELRLIDPVRVQTLVSAGGDVFYKVGCDDWAGIQQESVLPARSVIHHVINPLFHPLVGLSPLYAAALSGDFGEAARQTALKEYSNTARPGGIITAPGSVNTDKLRAIKDAWEGGYSGDNRGRTAVLADGMEFKSIEAASMTDAELINVLKLTTDQICGCYGVFSWMINNGSMPNYNGSSTGQQFYYQRTLQRYIEEMESLLAKAFSFGANKRVSFDTSTLLRLAPAEQMAVVAQGVGGSILSPNEARLQLNLPPVLGGDQPLAQQQYYSLASIAGRQVPAAAPVPQSAAEKAFIEAHGMTKIQMPEIITKVVKPAANDEKPAAEMPAA